MSFPASQNLLVNALQRVQLAAWRLRKQVANIRDASVAGNVSRDRFVRLLVEISSAIDDFDAAAAVPGIAQYARDQFSDQSLDIGAEFAAMRSAAVSLRDWVTGAFPVGAGGAWLVHTYNSSGQPTALIFTQAQLSAFVTQADALLATISA